MDTMVEAKYLAGEWKDIYNHERSPRRINTAPILGTLDRSEPIN